MTNIDKLYKRLKILYNEKFETEIKEEVELENKKDEDEYKNLGSNQFNAHWGNTPPWQDSKKRRK